jgi:hypothetical protein
MRMHSEKNAKAKPNEESAGLVEALVNELMVTMGTMRCYFLQ